MLRERGKIVYRVFFFSDACTTFLLFILASWACHISYSDKLERLFLLFQYFQLVSLIAFLWDFFLDFCGPYDSCHRLSMLRGFRGLFKVSFCSGFLLTRLAFALKTYLFPLQASESAWHCRAPICYGHG